MPENHDVRVTQTDYLEPGPLRDEPMLHNTPMSGDFVTHRSQCQSIRFSGTRLTADNRARLLGAFAGTNAYLRRKFGELCRKACMNRGRIDHYVTFAREMLAGPRAIGAVCPSSPQLARAMAGELDTIHDGLVLELGAGTGSITHALLQQGIAPGRLVAVERSAALVAHLRKRFPAIRVIEGDAAQLRKLLGDDADRVQAVVSGLPFRSLPRPVVQQISQQIRYLLPENGFFVQFTYDLRAPSVCCKDKALRNERTRIIWNNLPPARVDTFVRQASTS